MRHLSTQTFQCGVTIQGSTTLSGVTYLTALTNTSAWDYVVVGTSAQGQLFTRTYAQLMSDISSGITLSLDGLSDVVAPTPSTGQLLRYNGVQWANWTPTYYSLPSGGTTSQYIDGTGALQTFPTTLTAGTLTHQVKAGVAINKGQAVYVSSADGTNMIVSLASNASEATSSKTMGLLDATVSTNGFANVVTEGLLAGLDTTAAGAEGDPVWLGTGGNLIYGLANKPYAPAHLVFIGIVTRKNANNGEIFVKVQNGFELNEIHDVDLKTTVPVNGHILGFDGTLWVNKTIAGWLGYTPVSGTGTTNYLPKFTGSTSLGNSSFYDAGTPTIWVNSSNANSRFYFTPVHADGRINFGAIAGSADNVLIRAWHDGGKTGFGTGSSAGGGALTTYGDSVLIGPSGVIYFMNGTFGPLNVPYRLGISTSSTATYFSSGVSNNFTNIESNEFIFTAKSHTFYTGTTTGNQSSPNQYTPLFLSTAGNVGIGTTGLVPGYLLTINGGVSITAGQSLSLDPSAGIYMVASSTQFRLYNNSIAALSVASTGNVLINTTTDSGYKLDINGTARINSSLYITDPSYTGSGRLFQNGNNTLTLTGGPGGGTENITFGPSNRIFINASQTRVSSLLQTAGGLSVGTFGYPSSYGAQAYISGSTTANAGGGRGLYIDSTIVAAANNDVLVGLDINPTFTNGAFTGVSNLALRVAYSSGRYISFRAAPGYADFGQIVFSNVTGADIISSGTIGLGPSDTYKTLTLGNGITSKITTPGSTKYDGFGNQQPPTLAVSTNLPFLFTSNIPDGNIDGFIFENLNSGSRNLFKVIQNNTTLFTLNPNGNVLIGTTTDSGYKLDVNGNAILRSGTLNLVGNYLGISGTCADVNIFNNCGSQGNIGFTLGGNRFFNIWQVTGSSSGNTSGTHSTLSSSPTYAWSSGTAISNHLLLAPTINNTGTYSGIFRGFYYNPTLTSLTGTTHRGMEIASGDFIWGGGYSQYYGDSIEGFVQFQSSGNSTKIWIRPSGNQGGFNSNYWGYLENSGYTTTLKAGQYHDLSLAAETIRFKNQYLSEVARFVGSSGNLLLGTTTDSGYKLDVVGTARVKANSLTVSASGLSSPPANYLGINFDDNPNHHEYWFAIKSKKDLYAPIGTGYDKIIFPTMGNDNSTWQFNALGSYSRIQISATNNTAGNYLDLTNSSIGFSGSWTVASIDRTNRKLVFGNMSTDVHHIAVYDIVIKGAQPFENNYGVPNGGNIYIVGGTPSTTPSGNYGNVILAHDGTALRGLVGIGTNSPSQLLHVAGNLRLTGAFYDSNNQAGTAGQILKSTGTGTDWVSLSEITGVDGTGTANYLAKWSDADTITNSQIYDNGTSVTINATSGGIYLNSNIGFGGPVNINDQFKFYYGQLQGNGNAYFTTYLSVGTSSNLGGTLNVRGAGATSATKSLYIPNSDDSRTLSYTDDGKLTLSNGTYTTKWYIGSGYNPTLEFSTRGEITWGNGAIFRFYSTGDTTDYRLENGTFYTNNSQARFYAGGSGYLGFQTIGTTTPYDAIGAVFTDNNTVSLRFFYKNTGSDIEGMRLTSSGNFLIGTTTDSGYKLNVAGTTQIASSSGNYKLVVKTTGSGNGAGLLVDQLGYTMLDVNASDVYMRPYPNTYSKIDFYNWSAPGGVHNTFVLKNTEFTPQGGYAIPLVRFPDNTVPVVIGNTATASLRSYFTVGGTFTAKSSLGSGQSITTSLSASANNDVLVGLDINPTFTNGAFTGVGNFSLRAYGYSNFQSGINIYPGNPVINSSGIPVQGALFTWGGDTVNYHAGYQSGSGFYHKFWTNSTERVRISDGYTSIVSGNLLVGTTIDSGYKLDVNGIFRLGPAGGQLYSTVGNTLQANFGNAQFAVGSSGGESIDLSANSTGEIRFGTASTQRMVIKNDGNVGIGTNLPAYKLDVVGGIRSTYLTTSVVHGEGNTLLLLSGLNGANPGVNEARLHLGYNQNDPVVRLNSNGVSVNTGTWVFLPQIWFAGGITSNHNTALTIDGMSNGVTSGTAGEIIRFTQRNGQFASFYDAGAGLSEFRIWQQTNSSNYIYLKPGQTSYFSTGSLVIGGTTDSGYKLDVNGTVRFGDLGNVYYATLTSGGADGGIFRVGGASYGYAQLQSYALTLNGGHGISGTGGTAQFSITSQVSPSAAQSNAAIRFVADNPGSGGGTWGAYSTALAFNFLKKETSGSYTSILAMNGGTNNVGIGTTTPGSKLTIDGVLANNIGITLQDSGTWRSSYFVGNGGTFINAWSNGLHLGVDGNNLMKFTWDSKIGVGQLSPTARFQIKGSGSTLATTSLLVENSVGTTVFTVKDDGYIRPYYGINFGSDSPSTGNGGLIYPYDSGVAIQAYGASAGNSRYGRLEVGRVIPTSNFLGYFVGTTIGTNSTVFGATSDGSNVSTWFYFGDNLSNIVVSAIVNIDSTTRGFLQPRMTNTQVNAISTPATGLQAYDTTNNKNMLYDSTAWRNIATETWVTSQNYVPQARTLTINGTTYDLSANRSWTIATTTPGGSNTQFQYNNGGSLAGASALTYNSATNRIGINQASPGYDLDVNGQVRVQDKLRVGTVNSGNGVVHMSSSATINPNTTTIVWAQNVSVGMCAFIEYYILNNNSLTDQRAGTIMVTWNQSGTPTIAHTETTTPDIGSTTSINFTSSLVGSDARINAVNSSANPYTIVMSYKYF